MNGTSLGEVGSGGTYLDFRKKSEHPLFQGLVVFREQKCTKKCQGTRSEETTS